MSRRMTAYILMTVCMLVQIATVMPHHHHNHLLCLHDDLEDCHDCTHTDECGCGSTHEQDGGHHECESCCITHFLFDDTSIGDDEATPEYTFSYTLLYILPNTIVEDQDTSNDASGFTERLHGISPVGSKGLRSPPQTV